MSEDFKGVCLFLSTLGFRLSSTTMLSGTGQDSSQVPQGAHAGGQPIGEGLASQLNDPGE